MPGLPAGTVTFLFTDIEGSTELLERLPDAYADALRRHDVILRSAVSAHGGVVFETVGDAVYAAFSRTSDAIASALDAQVALRREPWGGIGEIRVRMAIHSGEVEQRGDHYFGRPLYRCARLMATGYGGQVLISSTAAALAGRALPAGTSLRSLGKHRLKDLADPEEPHQLVHEALIAEFPPLRSLNAHPNNLPLELSSFVGRDHELSEVRRLLDERRLVTITGPGGSGKTRLALQVAADTIDAFADGAFFVPLSAVSDPRLVLSEIARVLGVTEVAGQSLGERLKGHLVSRRLLVVLDNFEQVIAAGGTVAEMIGAGPGLKVLVTSRGPLRVSGEQEFSLPPLDLPDRGDLLSLERLSACESVQLFADRAAQARPDFTITSGNVRAVSEICRRLDGLPLALELAAVRVKLLDPEALLRRLERRFALLTDGRRDAPARQQTLRAAIAWSDALLGKSESELLRRLGVFAGGFTLESVEAVCGSDSGLDVLEGISALADQSLVRQDHSYAERFTMLATIREYALEQLGEYEDADAIRRRHAKHFLAIAQRAREASTGEQSEWFNRLHLERENIRAAIEWSVARGEMELGLRLSAAAAPFWRERLHWAEGVALLRLVLGISRGHEVTAEQAAALDALGGLLIVKGDLADARSAFKESVTIWRALGNRPRIAEALMWLGEIAFYNGDYAKAAALTEEALTNTVATDPASIAEASRTIELEHNLGASRAFGGDLEGGISLLREVQRKMHNPVTGYILGELERMRGDYEHSAEMLRDSLGELRARSTETPLYEFYSAQSLATLGLTTMLLGDRAGAATLCLEGLESARRLGHQIAITVGLDVMAIILVELGKDKAAARLFGAADALRERTGMAVWEPLRRDADKARDQGHHRLGADGFASAYREGRSQPAEGAVDAALKLRHDLLSLPRA